LAQSHSARDPGPERNRLRERQQHFVYSKVLNWIALDRCLRLADKRALPVDRTEWLSGRDKTYEEVMT
jgi:GH15 family glucan-1,4-alpha-glucosidase